MEKSTRGRVYRLTVCALMAAVMCVLGPLSVPIGPVPIAFANLVIYLAVYLLGWKWGTVSTLVYLLVGLAGLPVFAGYASGGIEVVDLYPVRAAVFYDHAGCKCGRFDKCTHYILDARLKCHADDKPGKIRVYEDAAVAVPPVKGDKSALSRFFLGCF